MKKTIHVTRDDIVFGGRGESTCPIACAIRRETGIYSDIKVSSINIQIDGKNHPTPQAAAAFVRRFDENNEYRNQFDPFDFELDV